MGSKIISGVGFVRKFFACSTLPESYLVGGHGAEPPDQARLSIAETADAGFGPDMRLQRLPHILRQEMAPLSRENPTSVTERIIATMAANRRLNQVGYVAIRY